MEFIRTCESKNIKPVILFIYVQTMPPYALFVEKMRKEVSSKDIPVIDFTEASSFDPSKLRIKPNGVHLSPYGNELLAKHIARQLSVTKTQ